MDMATTPLDSQPESGRQAEELSLIRLYRRLGLWNGLLIGLALALGIWLPQAIRLADVPTSHRYGSLIVAAMGVVAICTFTGWLTARIRKWPMTLVLWVVAGIAVAMLVAYQPNWLRNALLWLGDSRFLGRAVYSGLEATTLGIVLSGFFVILLLVVFAILQDYRLETIQQALGPGGRVTSGALAGLVVPVLFVAGAGLVTANIYGSAASPAALSVVNQAVARVQSYEGDDLVGLGEREGINYSALRGVRDRIGGAYTLILGETDAAMSLTTVTAIFDNGAWINCSVINEQLTFCSDASGPYTLGLASLITGEPLAADCRGCMPQVDASLAGWLAEQGRSLSGEPQIERVVQEGSLVLMRVTDEGGDPVMNCWFEGNAPVVLQMCQTQTD
jgi:hypothetical protein